MNPPWRWDEPWFSLSAVAAGIAAGMLILAAALTLIVFL